MADQPSASGNDADRIGKRAPERRPPDGIDPAEATTGMPTWVKVFGIVGLVLALLIVVMLLTGHGPGRHLHGGVGGHVAPVGLTVSEGTPCDGYHA